jgi:hypothetical protein
MIAVLIRSCSLQKHGKECMYRTTVCAFCCFAVMMLAAGVCFGKDYGSSDFCEGYFTVFGGGGATNPSGNVLHGSMQLGADIEMTDVVNFKEKSGIPFGFLLEGGYTGPVNDLVNGSALFSINYVAQFLAARHKPLTAFATAGYTRLFGTGNALNYGGGINVYIKDQERAIRFEVRDYFRISGAREHSVAFRIGYLFAAVKS